MSVTTGWAWEIETPTRWEQIPFRITGGKPYRLLFGDRDLDFIDLPCPILSMGVGPFGVALQCADHGLYMLYTHTFVSDVDGGWAVMCVWKG